MNPATRQFIQHALEAAALPWLAISLTVLACWAVKTRLGFRPLQKAPRRPSLLQGPGVLLVLLVFFGTQFVAVLVLSAAGLYHIPTTTAATAPDVDPVGSLWLLGSNMTAQAVALLAVLTTASMAFAGGLAGFGLRLRDAGSQALRGLGCLLVVFPVVMALLAATEALFRRLKWELKPNPLLRIYEQGDYPAVIALGLVAAVLVAPVVEECLFRGIIQSFLGRVLTRMIPPLGRLSMALSRTPPELTGPAPAWPPQPPVQAEPLEPPAADAAAPPLASLMAEPAPDEPLLPPPRYAARIMVAIVLTALLFAVVHPPKDQPAIFLLALALGYVYERTGSLVAAITMHLGFNAFNSVLFFLFHGSRQFGP